ncbi:peptide transporter family 1-like [Cimex lectularius]|uniref:Oligopeptide transporter 1 n=1 Tax=Cimex lectularius TaxID=79782 RepID=A0A8I6RTY0_CIMLE|nr:peptide transporter family 1-like [Cimex lectularius]
MSSNGQETPPPPPYSEAGVRNMEKRSGSITSMALSNSTVKEKEEKLKYPKSVFFIISNEFCERFSYYGMRTILALYLAYLGFTENQSTMIYHVFVMLCYFTPLIGGIIADSYLGKYKTIFYVSLLYAFGNVILSIGSIKSLGINHIAISMMGLILIGAGTGGIKPCVSSFGGDQFVLPQQEKQLQKFFSLFYFSINAGSVISCFITPMLRESVPCFEDDVCYPLAFGLPALLMCLSVVIFVCGKPMYKIKPPTKGNVALDVIKCWGHAISRKIKIQKKEPRDHWLDYADDKFSLKFIEETKIVLKLCYLFAPTIIFWALYEQQGSRWTFQASHMDGDIGFYVLQPDQMQTINAVLCLVFIPIFESVFYPVLEKLKIIRTPLQKLSYGGLLAALSFIVSALIQLKIEALEPVLPSTGIANLRLYNTLNCPVSVSSTEFGIRGEIMSFDTMDFPALSVSQLKDFNLEAKYGKGCPESSGSFSVKLESGKISSYMFTNEKKISLEKLDISGGETIEKSKDGNVKIKAIYGGGDQVNVTLLSPDNSKNMVFNKYQSSMLEMKSYVSYKVLINGKLCDKPIYLKSGGVYTLMIIAPDASMTERKSKLLTITEPNSVNMLWQLPQYVIITFAEIMFSITGIEFSFTQSPNSMKSVVSSLWLVTDSLGNVIILFIAGMKMFDNQSSEFFLYGGLMTIVMGMFIILANNYEYVDASLLSEGAESEKDEESKS